MVGDRKNEVALCLHIRLLVTTLCYKPNTKWNIFRKQSVVTNSTIYQNVDLYDEFNRVSEGRMHNIRILFLNLDFNEVMCTKFSTEGTRL